ncbi:hypothetical protein CPB84DRAFT_1789191 [Gymnopilus junonius]|uniref:Uncharacterized protein n=1 Tax=Gymnopilus junonius TaxID=109634 RepID=A0A9P5NDV3_GYMJU|nr:hypothetical protein CPB84DRAFT_1789191 [Gymnopilus junonius]
MSAADSLEVKVYIRYQGLKATQYFTKFTWESMVEVREDLTALKLPQPKKENVNLLSHGCVECVWQNVPYNQVRWCFWCLVTKIVTLILVHMYYLL